VTLYPARYRRCRGHGRRRWVANLSRGDAAAGGGSAALVVHPRSGDAL